MRALASSLILALLMAGCARAPDRDPCAERDAGRPVDATLLAFLGRARSAHHAADQLEESVDLARAVEVLRAVAEGPLPPGDAAEVREVLADTFARIADLESRRGAFDAARAAVERGLALAAEPTYFRGHLYEVQGLVWERNAAELRKSGDEAAARAASSRALEALETSMQIQGDVIRRAVPAPSR